MANVAVAGFDAHLVRKLSPLKKSVSEQPGRMLPEPKGEPARERD